MRRFDCNNIILLKNILIKMYKFFKDYIVNLLNINF